MQEFDKLPSGDAGEPEAYFRDIDPIEWEKECKAVYEGSLKLAEIAQQAKAERKGDAQGLQRIQMALKLASIRSSVKRPETVGPDPLRKRRCACPDRIW